MEGSSQAPVDEPGGSSGSEDSGDEFARGKRMTWTADVGVCSLQQGRCFCKIFCAKRTGLIKLQEDAALLEVIRQHGQARHWNALAEVGNGQVSSASLLLKYAGVQRSYLVQAPSRHQQ